MVAVINVDAYPFLVFSYLTCLTLRIRKRCFLIVLGHLIVRRPNLEVLTKKLFHQQVKILG